MKVILKLHLFACISVLALNGIVDSKEYNENNYSGDSLDTVVVNFDFNEDLASSPWKNIYVIWMEDTAATFIQNIFICQKLITGGLTGTALPFWKTNKYPVSSSTEIDAVTSATKANTDFSISTVLKDSSIRNFVIYFEVDKSFDANDWFTDQPALLYAVNVNLDDDIDEYELLPIGWTPNEQTQNKIPNTPIGKLQEEMRYITNHKEGSNFGNPDERSSTKMVKNITAIIKSSVATNIITSFTDYFDISIFPNPVRDEVNIKSKEVIEEVAIINLQGQTLARFQPNTIETTFLLSKDNAANGIYFVKIKTSLGISSHKIHIVE